MPTDEASVNQVDGTHQTHTLRAMLAKRRASRADDSDEYEASRQDCLTNCANKLEHRRSGAPDYHSCRP